MAAGTAVATIGGAQADSNPTVEVLKTPSQSDPIASAKVTADKSVSDSEPSRLAAANNAAVKKVIELCVKAGYKKNAFTVENGNDNPVSRDGDKVSVTYTVRCQPNDSSGG